MVPWFSVVELLGTPGYLSPEMLRVNMDSRPITSGYGTAVDMWACGVVMYTLIAGNPPFWHRKQMKMLRDIMDGRYSFSGEEWEDVSEEAKDLVSYHTLHTPSALRVITTN